jgi:hypothetical protein
LNDNLKIPYGRVVTMVKHLTKDSKKFRVKIFEKPMLQTLKISI